MDDVHKVTIDLVMNIFVIAIVLVLVLAGVAPTRAVEAGCAFYGIVEASKLLGRDHVHIAALVLAGSLTMLADTLAHVRPVIDHVAALLGAA